MEKTGLYERNESLSGLNTIHAKQLSLFKYVVRLSLNIDSRSREPPMDMEIS